MNLAFDGDTQDGSRSNPYDSLEQALAAADEGERIYVCGNEAMPLIGPFVIDESVELYGGWGCLQWTKFDAAADGKTEWTAGAGEIPLKITGAGTVATVHGFAITSANATDAGDSSIALMIVDATVQVLDSAIVAGDGADGETMLPTDLTTPAADGVPGLAGCNNADALKPGQAGGINACGGMDVSGGPGGNWQVGSSGGSGTPGEPAANGGGAGGTGETTTEACDTGDRGDDGDQGDFAAGASGMGTLGANGLEPAAGVSGDVGTFGRGGGGGGGANGCSGPGPSGGGGGAGGCGGPGGSGGGGGGGGGSVGIAVVDGSVTVARTAVTAQLGGAGGGGARGGSGQVGGTQGGATPPACAGGPGGNGGEGGSGGGGRGGHSIAIAHTATAEVTLESGAALAAGTPGAGGAGGDGITIGNDGGAGLDGITANQQEL